MNSSLFQIAIWPTTTTQTIQDQKVSSTLNHMYTSSTIYKGEKTISIKKKGEKPSSSITNNMASSSASFKESITSTYDISAEMSSFAQEFKTSSIATSKPVKDTTNSDISTGNFSFIF